MKNFVLLVIISFLSAELSTGQEVRQKGPVIYFTRPDVYAGSLSKLDIIINGASVASLKNNSTFVFPLQAAGNVVIKVSGSGANRLMAKSQELSLITEDGKNYFVEVGWTTSLTKPIYIKQVAYEQVAAMFPGLSGNMSQEKLQTSVSQQPSTQQENTKKEELPVQTAVDVQSFTKTSIETPAKISLVDKNIPVNPSKKPYLFALVIGNEDYSSFQPGLSSEVNVAFAQNDAQIFKEYLVKTLGAQEENVIILLNARAIEMNRAITKIALLAKNSGGKAEIILFYAGHGFPDEATKDPYLMPVDVSGTDLQFAIKLNDLYKKLTEFPVQRVTIFLDACFSGGGRGAGLVTARGVKIRPKETELNGNIVVFTSSSGEQSSLSYKEQQHGMFTYFLLKKLQETKGKMTYKELAGYLSEQVSLTSIRVNDKEQNPQVNISPQAQSAWESWSLIQTSR